MLNQQQQGGQNVGNVGNVGGFFGGGLQQDYNPQFDLLQTQQQYNSDMPLDKYRYYDNSTPYYNGYVPSHMTGSGEMVMQW